LRLADVPGPVDAPRDCRRGVRGHGCRRRRCAARRAPFPRPGAGAPCADRNPLAYQPAAASGPPARAQPRGRPLDPLAVALRVRPGAPPSMQSGTGSRRAGTGSRRGTC
jgi:hypothetical protein